MSLTLTVLHLSVYEINTEYFGRTSKTKLGRSAFFIFYSCAPPPPPPPPGLVAATLRMLQNGVASDNLYESFAKTNR